MSQSTYTYYRSALKGVFGAIHENDPQCGYYRMRRGRGGPWIPVAIWREATGGDQNSVFSDSGKLVCLVDGVERDPFEVWTWVCRYPVPYETYVAVAERGKDWPEDLPDLNKARSVSNSDPLQVSPSLEQTAPSVRGSSPFGSASLSRGALPKNRALVKLRLVDAAETFDDLKIPPGNRPEYLKGYRLGQISVRINDQWRLCFSMINGEVSAVKIVDYHR